jgi:hypothetical protein
MCPSGERFIAKGLARVGLGSWCDWEDARRKFVGISPSGRAARNAAVAAISPIVSGLVQTLGTERVRQVLPVLREMRLRFEGNNPR